MNKDIPAKAILLTGLDGRTLREIFHESDAEWDKRLLPSMVSLSFYDWPLDAFAHFFMQLDEVDPDNYEITNKKYIQYVGKEDGDEISDMRLSGTIWTKMENYFTALLFLRLHCQASFPEESTLLQEFIESSSFFLRARNKIFENGIEVGTRETESGVVLRSDMFRDKAGIKPDSSKAHDDPEELKRVARFNEWFCRKSSAGVIFTSEP